MNRKIGWIFVITFVTAFLALIIYSNIKESKRNPLDEEFYGVISKKNRLYPGLVEFSFENQNENFIMRSNLEKFMISVSIGDSIAKVKNDNFLTIFKENGIKYSYHNELDWD